MRRPGDARYVRHGSEASDERLRLLFEDAPVAYHEVDREGRIVRVNRAECAMLGYDSSELIGKPIWELVAAESRSGLRDSFLRKLNGAAPIVPFEATLLRAHGPPVTVGLYENPIEDEAGAVIGLSGILVNITERQQTMEALLASELKYRDLFDNVIDGVYQSTPDGRIITANPALVQMLGYDSESDLLNVDAATLYARSEERAVRMERLEREGELRGCELEIRARDGRHIHVLENARAVRDTDGAVSFYEGTLTDITGRVEAQRALTRERDFTSAVIDAAGSLIVVLDPRGRIIRFNRFCELISGYSFAEVQGREFWDVFIIPEEVGPLKEIFARLCAGENSIQHENHWETRDGELRLIEWSNVAMPGEQGGTAYIISTGLDVTDRRLAEEKLESYAREVARKNEELAGALTAAREATELKSRFLATMSHEIRTPLNGILGMTELLLATRLDSEQREYGQAVRHSAEALLTVINDVLDISKIEAGKLKLERVLFDPRSVINEVTELLRPRATDKGLRLLCHAPAELPRIMAGDPGRLRQILFNLIGNAVKFTDEGEVEVEARLAGSTAQTAAIRFLVRDTGIGISPEYRSRLFESFVQGDSSTTRKYGGTGLGLAISKQLVEMMGGQIDVESELGHGSAFTFHVVLENYHPESGEGASLAGQRALVIDAKPESGAFTSDYLNALGCRAETCNPASALGKIHLAIRAQDPYRIVLADLSLPEPDFSALHEAIVSDPVASGSVRIGLADGSVRGDRRLRRFGFAGVVQKPVEPAGLRDTLLAAIEKRAPVR